MASTRGKDHGQARHGLLGPLDWAWYGTVLTKEMQEDIC